MTNPPNNTPLDHTPASPGAAELQFPQGSRAPVQQQPAPEADPPPRQPRPKRFLAELLGLWAVGLGLLAGLGWGLVELAGAVRW